MYQVVQVAPTAKGLSNQPRSSGARGGSRNRCLVEELAVTHLLHLDRTIATIAIDPSAASARRLTRGTSLRG